MCTMHSTAFAPHSFNAGAKIKRLKTVEQTKYESLLLDKTMQLNDKNQVLTLTTKPFSFVSSVLRQVPIRRIARAPMYLFSDM